MLVNNLLLYVSKLFTDVQNDNFRITLLIILEQKTNTVLLKTK